MLPMEAKSKFKQGQIEARTCCQWNQGANWSKDKFKQRHVANGSKEQIEARSKDMLPMVSVCQ